MDLLLDVDRHNGHGEVLSVLPVLALPHQLWVERSVAGIQERLRHHLVVLHEVTQLVGRDVHARILVADSLNGARSLGTPPELTFLLRFLRHRFLAPWLAKLRYTG